MAAVDRAREEAEENWPPLTISASAIANPCERRHWLALRWFAPPRSYDAKTIRLRDRGLLERDRVVADLRDTGFIVEEVGMSASLAGGWLRGKISGIVQGVPEGRTQWHVLKVRALKATDWRRTVKLGAIEAQPDDFAQAQLFMASLGLDRALYWATNRDTEEIHVERWRLDNSVSDPLIVRAESVAQAVSMPPNIASSENHPACLFCNFRPVCHSPVVDMPWPARNCRTCIHYEMREPYRGHCSRWSQPRDLDEQKVGCPAHIAEPTMIPAEQVDAAEDGSWIEYQLPDGSTWRDAEDPGASPPRRDPTDPPF